MRKASLLILALLLLGCKGKEPLHKGKPASYWIEALQDRDAQVRRDAAGALAELKAKDAVPQLITALKDRDAGVRARAKSSKHGNDDGGCMSRLLNATFRSDFQVLD